MAMANESTNSVRSSVMFDVLYRPFYISSTLLNAYLQK